MARLLLMAALIGACLLVWKTGAFDSALQSLMPSTATSALPDPSAEMSKSVDAMKTLKSVHITVTGTLEFSDMGGVDVTGTGDLISPHKENLSLQLQLPRATYAVNVRIESGHEYIQIPSQSPTWKDVTGDLKSQVAPGMDPINNLEFLVSARASDSLGTIQMDHIDVRHVSVSVDPNKYVDQLKSDPSSGITPADEAGLANAGIQVEVWSAASDHFIHQMRIQMRAPKFTWDLTYHDSNFVTGGGTTSA